MKNIYIGKFYRWPVGIYKILKNKGIFMIFALEKKKLETENSSFNH